MTKNIFIILFSCFITTVFAADLVSDNSHNKVDNVDVDILLEVAPVKQQKGLLNNKKNLDKQLEQAYIKKVLAKMAKEEGLDKKPKNTARLQAIIDNALFMLKLDAVKHSSKKDFTKYAKQLYHANKADYKVEERIDAAHILASNKKIKDEEALAKIKKIKKELAVGADFQELALRESDDKTVKKNKGELGKFTKKQLVKEFTNVAFTMKLGEISEPVKTSFGYHIIKLNKKIPAGYLSFEEVKDKIINDLKEKDWEVRRANYYEQIKKDNKMEIDGKALDEYVVKKLEELDNL